MSNIFTIRFEMYGDLVIEAETATDAEQLAANSLIKWGGFGSVAQDVQIDGVTIIDDMTEAQS